MTKTQIALLLRLAVLAADHCQFKDYDLVELFGLTSDEAYQIIEMLFDVRSQAIYSHHIFDIDFWERQLDQTID